MSDDPVAVCTTCDAPVERVFHPVAVHFKGSGFYNTDYGKRQRSGEPSSSESDSSSEDSKPEKDSKSSEGKSEKKAAASASSD